MEANQEQPTQADQGAFGLSAKELAAAEEARSAQLKQATDKEQAEAATANQEPVSIIGLAAQGREVLLDALRRHNERAKPKEYVPPARTARQQETLEAELAAGRRTQEKAEAQQASRPPPEKSRNEGFTTPVHRPGDFVPNLNSRDPAIK